MLLEEVRDEAVAVAERARAVDARLDSLRLGWMGARLAEAGESEPKIGRPGL